VSLLSGVSAGYTVPAFPSQHVLDKARTTGMLCLPDEATPVTGCLTSGVCLDYGTKTNSSLSQIICKRFLNAFTDVAHTTSSSNLFHQLITRSEKKWCRRSVLILFFFNFLQIFRIGTVRYAEDLWGMHRHGPVIAHCTDSENFPNFHVWLRLLLAESVSKKQWWR